MQAGDADFGVDVRKKREGLLGEGMRQSKGIVDTFGAVGRVIDNEESLHDTPVQTSRSCPHSRRASCGARSCR